VNWEHYSCGIEHHPNPSGPLFLPVHGLGVLAHAFDQLFLCELSQFRYIHELSEDGRRRVRA
jgi:hypothetical protein